MEPFEDATAGLRDGAEAAPVAGFVAADSYDPARPTPYDTDAT